MPEWLITSCGIAFAALIAGAALFWAIKPQDWRQEDFPAPPLGTLNR